MMVENMENENDFNNWSKDYYTRTIIREREFFNIIENYNLTKNEENNSINHINQLLKEFNNELDLLSLETTYYSIMPLGRKICEDVLKLMLKKEGFFVTEYVVFAKMVQFARKYNLIPEKQYKDISLIKRYANQAIHGRQPTNKIMISFLQSFREIMEWFKSTYYEKNNPIQLEEINLKIKSNMKLLETKKDMETTQTSQKFNKYSYYKKEELDDINQINKLLNDYEKQLKLISSERKFYYAFTGSTITEMMLKLLLKKVKLYNPNVTYTFLLYVETLHQYKIIPNECENFLHLIRRYRNQFVHGSNQSNKLVLSFLRAFNYFIRWFDNHYYLNYQKKFQIEECCELIDLLNYDEENKCLIFDKNKEIDMKFDNELKLQESKTNQEILIIKKLIKDLNKEKEVKSCEIGKSSIDDTVVEAKNRNEYESNEEIKRLKKELNLKEITHQQQIHELNRKNDEILKKLDEYGKLFGKCMAIIDDINERGKRIEPKIDELHSKIDNISNQITTLQSLTQRQIQNAQSQLEIERIIEAYIDICIDNIIQQTLNFTENKTYEIEKTKLIYSIGDDGWNKLSEESKNFLITSKVMYNHLILIDDIIDYSGICVLITKALELEIQKRFFINFLDYLNEKYGRNYEKYHTALLYQKKKPLLSEKFTMGNIAFVMCYIENRFDNDIQKNNNKLRLMEYCKECVFSNYSEEEIKILLHNYASSIEDIRIKYRNPSAHTNEINRVTAEECFNLVLDIEKLLKKMLDSFDN